MASDDQTHWDERYRATDEDVAKPALPERFVPFAAIFAGAEEALEVACGPGSASVWLALQGVHVTGYDISPVAVARATKLAAGHGVADRCDFVAVDLDHGLPPGPDVDVVLCNMFRDPALDRSLIERLRPGGVLAIAALSEVGASPGRFRATPGEIVAAFSSLEVVASQEADGVAWLVARSPLDRPCGQ